MPQLRHAWPHEKQHARLLLKAAQELCQGQHAEQLIAVGPAPAF